jgi:protein O-GlcNAc transferase
MLIPNILQKRRVGVFLAIAGIFLLVTILSLYNLPPQTQLRDWFPDWKVPTSASNPYGLGSPQDDTTKTDDGVVTGEKENLTALPAEYTAKPWESPVCAERWGHGYLEKFRENEIGYCTPNSPANVTCFHAALSRGAQLDSLCIGEAALFDPVEKKFSFGCEPRELTVVELAKAYPALDNLRSYWYETGPAVIFNKGIKLDASISPPADVPNFTILLKREGESNPWHCLLEIWSMTMTLDILRMANPPLFSTADAVNTQIIILDERENGPYWDLWTIFAKRPPLRIKDLTETTKFENVIVPLAGATNPLWSGDWEPHPCERSELLHVFSQRALQFYGVNDQGPHDGDLMVTFIDRKEGRKLVNQEAYLQELETTIPHLNIQAIDFTAIDFRRQLEIIRKTDILVGVHGAGLTHGMFLREGSVMVEILPETLNYKGFRNLAGIAGHTYLSAHGKQADGSSSAKRGGVDWHNQDVSIEKDRFLQLMGVAVKSLYNKGLRNWDVVKK